MTEEEELKALELIESIPTLDELIPVQIICIGRDESVEIPKVLKEYLIKLNELPKLDKDGKIHYKDYLKVFERNDINQLAILPIRTIRSK